MPMTTCDKIVEKAIQEAIDQATSCGDEVTADELTAILQIVRQPLTLRCGDEGIGAGGRTRTGKGLPPSDFESDAVTISPHPPAVPRPAGSSPVAETELVGAAGFEPTTPSPPD